MTVAATAASTLSPAQSACAFPVAVCSHAGTGGTAANNYNHFVGQRMVAVNSPGDAYGTGNFGWVDFTPPANSGNELYNLAIGAGSCAVSLGQQVGAQGQKTNVERAWNARFGTYHNTLNASIAPPDFTGYGFPSGDNNYAAYVTQLNARSAFQGTIPNSYNPTTGGPTGGHGLLGQMRRVQTAVVVDCAVWTGSGSGQPPVVDFACVLLLAPVQQGGGWDANSSTTMDIEYLGLASAVGSPCATSGLAGGTFGPLVPTLVQ
jgi:hypothetical protein